jgi:hypothetical protein
VNTDEFLDRRYHAKDYNCAHFACDVWAAATGTDLRESLSGFLTSPARRRADLGQLRRVKWLARPESPCLVWCQRPGQSHVGVFLRGKMLHLLEQGGVQFMPLHVATVGFNKVRFFRFQ